MTTNSTPEYTEANAHVALNGSPLRLHYAARVDLLGNPDEIQLAAFIRERDDLVRAVFVEEIEPGRFLIVDVDSEDTIGTVEVQAVAR